MTTFLWILLMVAEPKGSKRYSKQPDRTLPIKCYSTFTNHLHYLIGPNSDIKKSVQLNVTPIFKIKKVIRFLLA
ncbi:hypothetical protein ASU31_11260 [Pedobacter ginsenosidimutans]|uniref:Uncharacterized protein n=1 Tax=Pedobacter ginsenosidimutans TaxID=687842 RepID=A0A0T5VQC9_9SPHI|nr:hypothetical protein ASU31_11260 [Pedobacter ginsenosidimutans]